MLLLLDVPLLLLLLLLPPPAACRLPPHNNKKESPVGSRRKAEVGSRKLVSARRRVVLAHHAPRHRAIFDAACTLWPATPLPTTKLLAYCSICLLWISPGGLVWRVVVCRAQAMRSAPEPARSKPLEGKHEERRSRPTRYELRGDIAFVRFPSLFLFFFSFLGRPGRSIDLSSPWYLGAGFVIRSIAVVSRRGTDSGVLLRIKASPCDSIVALGRTTALARGQMEAYGLGTGARPSAESLPPACHACRCEPAAPSCWCHWTRTARQPTIP